MSLLAVVVLSLPNAGAVPDVKLPTTRLVVGFHDLDESRTWERVRRLGATGFVPLTTIDAAIVTGPPTIEPLLRRLPGVRYVEQDARARFANYQTDAQTGVGTVRSGASPLETGYTGDGVTVAVVDTGVGVHPDLVGQVVDHLNFEAAGLYAGVLAQDERDRLIQTVPPAAGVVATHGLSVAATVAGTGVAHRAASTCAALRRARASSTSRRAARMSPRARATIPRRSGR